MRRPTCNVTFDCPEPALTVDEREPGRTTLACPMHAIDLRIAAALRAGERLPRPLAERVCTRLAYGPALLDLIVTGRKPVAA